jgi:hypothetical protein
MVLKEHLLSFSTISFVFQFAVKKCKIKMYITLILPVVLYGCKTWFVFEERLFENRVLRKLVLRGTR